MWIVINNYYEEMYSCDTYRKARDIRTWLEENTIGPARKRYLIIHQEGLLDEIKLPMVFQCYTTETGEDVAIPVPYFTKSEEKYLNSYEGVAYTKAYTAREALEAYTALKDK